MVKTRNVFKYVLYGMTVLAIFATTLAVAQENTSQVGSPVGSVDFSVHVDALQQGAEKSETQLPPGQKTQPQSSVGRSQWAPTQFPTSSMQSVPGASGDRLTPEVQDQLKVGSSQWGFPTTSTQNDSGADQTDAGKKMGALLRNPKVKHVAGSSGTGENSLLKFATPVGAADAAPHSASQGLQPFGKGSSGFSAFGKSTLKSTGSSGNAQDQRKKKHKKAAAKQDASAGQQRLNQGSGSAGKDSHGKSGSSKAGAKGTRKKLY
jgi:hypothetical protein